MLDPIAGSSVAYNAILSIGIVSLLTSYLISTSCILWKRINKQTMVPARWSLGRLGAFINAFGLAYLFIAWVFAFFPIYVPVELTTSKSRIEIIYLGHLSNLVSQ